MAQPSDNTLGAPTEGLGQTVTFAYNSDAGVPQLQIGDPGRIRGGVIGGPAGVGNTRAAGVAMPGPNPTLDALLKVGGALLAPVIEQRKTEQYVAGMQRAMQGEAVTDIANSRPWYSKLFGETDVIEGARAYTGNTRAQTVVAAMEDQMPELRKMDGPTAQQYFTDAIINAKTGDAATDLAVMQAMTRAMPAVMRRQAKEHYGYQQERATAAEDASFKSGVDLLQKQGEEVVRGYVTPEDYAVARKQFIKSQVPANGRDEKNWKDAQTKRYVEAAMAGKFHAVQAGYEPLEEGGPSVIDTLDTDQRLRIEAAVQAGQQKQRTAYLPNVAEKMADIELRATHPPEGTTPQMLYDEALNMNKEFSARTGNKLGPWTPAELVAIKKGAGNAIWHARQQEAARVEANAKVAGTAAAKAEAEAAKTTLIRQSAAGGNLYNLAGTPEGPTTERINYEATRLYRELDSDGQAKLLIANDKHTIPNIAAERDKTIESMVSAKKIPDGDTDKAYAEWKKLNDVRPDVAAAYYPKTGPKLVMYDRLIQGGFDKVGAYNMAFVNPITPAKPNKEVREATINEIQSRENGFFKGSMHPDSVRLLANATDDLAATYEAVLGSAADGATRAYNVTKASGKTESIGKYAWLSPSPDAKFLPWLVKKKGDLAAPAGGQVALAANSVGSIFDRAVAEFIGGARISAADGSSYKVAGITPGKEPTHIMFAVAGTAPDGSPLMQISAMDDEGNVYKGGMSGNDVFKLAERHKASEAAAGTGKSQAFVTPGNRSSDIIRPNLVGPNPRANVPQ